MKRERNGRKILAKASNPWDNIVRLSVRPIWRWAPIVLSVTCCHLKSGKVIILLSHAIQLQLWQSNVHKFLLGLTFILKYDNIYFLWWWPPCRLEKWPFKTISKTILSSARVQTLLQQTSKGSSSSSLCISRALSVLSIYLSMYMFISLFLPLQLTAL